MGHPATPPHSASETRVLLVDPGRDGPERGAHGCTVPPRDDGHREVEPWARQRAASPKVLSSSISTCALRSSSRQRNHPIPPPRAVAVSAHTLSTTKWT